MSQALPHSLGPLAYSAVYLVDHYRVPMGMARDDIERGCKRLGVLHRGHADKAAAVIILACWVTRCIKQSISFVLMYNYNRY